MRSVAPQFGTVAPHSEDRWNNGHPEADHFEHVLDMVTIEGLSTLEAGVRQLERK